MHADVLIVGAGHGGAQLTIRLRQRGFVGSILMVSKEDCLPYEKPPLSKEYLSGDLPPERLLVRLATFWKEKGIDLLLGEEVIKVDPIGREAEMAGGLTVSFTNLVWAAGGKARTLDLGDELGRDFRTLRTQEDANGLRVILSGPKRSVGVVGAGYIGLEAAASLRKAGHCACIIEREGEILSRVASAPMAQFVRAEHERRGVTFRLSVGIDTIVKQDGRLAGLALASGERVLCDLVIVGIGITPEIAPLTAAGAVQGERGVLVDTRCRTNLPGVFLRLAIAQSTKTHLPVGPSCVSNRFKTRPIWRGLSLTTFVVGSWCTMPYPGSGRTNTTCGYSQRGSQSDMTILLYAKRPMVTRLASYTSRVGA